MLRLQVFIPFSVIFRPILSPVCSTLTRFYINSEAISFIHIWSILSAFSQFSSHLKYIMSVKTAKGSGFEYRKTFFTFMTTIKCCVYDDRQKLL